MLYFSFVGTIADVDQTTADDPHQPSPVLLPDAEDTIPQVVFPESVWPVSARDALRVGRRLRVAGYFDLNLGRTLPVALTVRMLDAQ